MSDYRVKLAAPAAKVYREVSTLAAASGKESQNSKSVLSLLDRVIDDVLASNPHLGTKLVGPFNGVYWFTEGLVQFFYEVHLQAMAVTVLSIMNVPLRKDHSEQVDVLCTKMLMTGTFSVPQLRVAARRAAAN